MLRAKLVVCLSLLAGACTGRGVMSEERPLLARVSGMPIYVDEFKRELLRIKLDGEEGIPAAGSAEAQKQALLDDLIERRLVLQECERKNVVVSSAEVEASFERSRAGWKEEDFTALLKEQDTTPAELKAELRDQLVIRKYFRDHVFSRVAVTDAEIETHLQAHPEALVDPEQVRAQHIVVKTEEEAQRVLQEIKAGTAFEDAAMKYSLSPEGKNGGDLGWFPRGVMPATFDEVCFGLSVGQISKVVPSDYGFHVFKVLERRAAQPKNPALARERIEAELRREKEREAQLLAVAALKKAATIVVQEEQLARVH